MRKIKRKIAEIKNENKMRLNNNFKIQPTDVENVNPALALWRVSIEA